MAQCQLNISPILALVHTIHPACARLISLVANILATSVKEGMLSLWDTTEASPARTMKRNKLPPGEQETWWWGGQGGQGEGETGGG